jgi:LuxR family transcriptional regulator, regulator of acetate metabolism
MALSRPQAADDVSLAFARVAEAMRRLRNCREPGELLALGASIAREECGFSRGVILGVAEREFNAADSDALPDPASDRIRRAVLAEPIAFTRRSAEEALLAAVGTASADKHPTHPAHPTHPSVLAAQLGLRHHVLEPIVIRDSPVAMLVLDRDIPEITPPERALATSYATIVAMLLEQLLLQARTADIVAELRRITAFSGALAQEALSGQPVLPSVRASEGVMAWRSTPAVAPAIRPERILSPQELRVAKLLAAGRSNREIAAELVLSVDTIKSHVARVLQKLEVNNRAQAAVLMAGGDIGR